MNRMIARIAFALLTLVLATGQVQAQFTTTFAKNVTPGQKQQKGMYYSLPQTLLKLDFVIEETTLERSPLSEYASKYMEMTDYVEYDATEYQLLDVKVSTITSPDPNALFFVTFNSVRGNNFVQFNVLPNGILSSVGLVDASVEEDIEVVENEIIEEPEIISVISENSMVNLITTGKTNAQLAKEVADKIEEIRKAKYNLISGYYETAYLPETFNLMYQKLDEMEKEYTNLLLGKRVVKTMVKTLYVIPNKEVTTQTVAKFSESEGLTEGTAGSGNSIAVQTLSLNTTAAINAPSQSAVESMSYENKVFYRIPETAIVKVIYDGKTLMEDRVTVNQLGSLLTAPMTNSKLVFDTKTGQIVNMRMK